MPVYTVKVTTRPRPTKTQIRRKLKGRARGLAHAAMRYLNSCIFHDNKLTTGGNPVAASQLIFAGDATQVAAAQAVAVTLAEALASKLKIITK
jgi:hypothetical protein